MAKTVTETFISMGENGKPSSVTITTTTETNDDDFWGVNDRDDDDDDDDDSPVEPRDFPKRQSLAGLKVHEN